MQDNMPALDDYPLAQVDGRTREARRFKAIVKSLCDQMGREPTTAEFSLVTNAALCQMLVERDALRILQGDTENTPDERMRRNMAAAKACLSSLGLIKQARDIRIGDLKSGRGKSLLSQVIESEDE